MIPASQSLWRTLVWVLAGLSRAGAAKRRKDFDIWAPVQLVVSDDVLSLTERVAVTSDSSGLNKQIWTFDVYDPQLHEQDLHPFFDELRRKCPVVRTDVPGGDGPL